MNISSYASLYSNFRRITHSLIRHDIIMFELGHSPFETFMVARMYPVESIMMDSTKQFVYALKSFFKSDVITSVFSNNQDAWTICLGNERVIYPVSQKAKPHNNFYFYATPYFVQNPQILNEYLQRQIGPTYENVYFYKNTIMYLDNKDLPYPGGYYFDECDPTPFYRICFLSNESIDYIFNLISEIQFKKQVLTIPTITRDITALPKFIDFKPVSEFNFSESNVISTGIIQRKMCSKKPEHIIQDILFSYYKNSARFLDDKNILDFTYLGLLIEWPIKICFEGGRPTISEEFNRKFVALSINGNHPSRVVTVLYPYDRYVEYNQVPATIWTPISFVFSTLLTDIDIKKVVLDTVVVGLVYRDIFFCLAQPLFEGRPTNKLIQNGEYLLSVASTADIEKDPNIKIIESFKYNDEYSLRRVSLNRLAFETWCLTRAETTHPYPKNIRLPHLVKEWLDFFMQVSPNAHNVDVSVVRLALALSKHNICYNLVATTKDSKDTITINDKEINFYMNKEVIQFINDARVTKQLEKENDSYCTIM